MRCLKKKVTELFKNYVYLLDVNALFSKNKFVNY